jgi:transcriptional antiterminator NusG
MAANEFKWYVLRAISGKENKVKEYIEGALVTSTLFKEYVSQVLIPTEKVIIRKERSAGSIHYFLCNS